MERLWVLGKKDQVNYDLRRKGREAEMRNQGGKTEKRRNYWTRKRRKMEMIMVCKKKGR